MKNSTLGFAAIAVVMITLSSCGKDGLGIKGSGPIVTETREINSFTKVKLEGSADIYIIQDSIQSVVVEGQANILEVLETKVSGNEVCIGFGNHCVRNYESLKIYISVPDLEKVKIEGSGNIFGNGVILVNNITFDVEGSGNIEMENLQANQLETKISGSGDITYHGSGTLQYHHIDIDGSGKVKAFDLATNSVKINIDGSGDCRVQAIQQLEVHISGSGDVYYTGLPVISSHISGSGNLINSN